MPSPIMYGAEIYSHAKKSYKTSTSFYVYSKYKFLSYNRTKQGNTKKDSRMFNFKHVKPNYLIHIVSIFICKLTRGFSSFATFHIHSKEKKDEVEECQCFSALDSANSCGFQ